ncbi:putative serine protease PepD [Streptomonospora nanhaiensis]|uniref:Putative serine protease PepD n=1 Tax=Streptomonospora nanhaiensis TaxID=1323731 RepID=A0A853BSX9_9ACTN|nr:trypsin-like peptidase domain-containing protein [Streptomonospora nanhaiensis]NYI97611.1 putative serine protease PepD [Streptomonospora nanhaiensis]
MSATDPTKGSPHEGQDGDGRQPEPAEASAADTAVLGAPAAPSTPGAPAPSAEPGEDAPAAGRQDDAEAPRDQGAPPDAEPQPAPEAEAGADGGAEAATGPGADPTPTPVPWRSAVANRPPRSQSAPRFGEPEAAPAAAAAATGEPGGAPAEAPADTHGEPRQAAPAATPYGQTDPYGTAGAFSAPGGGHPAPSSHGHPAPGASPAWAAPAAPAAAGAAAGGAAPTDPYGTAEPGRGPGGYGGPPGPGGPEHAAHSGGWHAGGPAGPAGPGGPGGGYGPPPPYDPAHLPPGGDRPPREPFFKRNRVLLVAAITAIITSAIVGPAAAVISTYFLGGTQNSLTDPSEGSVSSGTVSNVAEAALPSVVSIEAGAAGGSGVIISSDGQILTNNHVVAGAKEAGGITVQFNDGSEARAEVLGADPVSDLAVIQAEGQSGLTAADLGDSDKVEVGADVVAIGSPLGLSGTVTSGVVSAVDRPVNTGVSGQEEQPQNPFGLPEEQDPFSQQPEQQQGQTSTVINAIQTDAPINPGNSGGPLMNMSGEVIGINTAIVGTSGSGGESGSIGLGFAIPINQAKPIAEQLIADGSAEYAAIEATISGQADSEGATIVETTNDGAADQAGLREGDVITSIEGEQMESSDAVIAAVRSHQPGDTITVGYVRDGRERETQVTLSAQSSESIGN